MKKNKILPVVLCGGKGSRLWPLSRESYPKQFLPLKANGKLTLMQKTIKRILNLECLDNPLLICNEEHRFIVKDQLDQIKVKPKSIFLEPCQRNTAPAILISALFALENNEDPHLLVLAADHEIKNVDRFLYTIKEGLIYSEKGHIVTFGIIPTSPETGFGYIEASIPSHSENINGLRIKRFIEKPDEKKAKELIQDKRFFWNSGMFCLKASTIVKEFEKYNPNLLIKCKIALKQSFKDLSFQRLENETFGDCEDISIDHALMEKTELGIVLPLDVGWNDIGSWKSLRDLEEKDENGNVIVGNVLSRSSRNCYLRSESRLIVGLGIENLIVVETNDAVLIANPAYGQEVKNVINELEKLGKTEGKLHKKVFRPWGNYLTIIDGMNFQVKKIEVKVGGSLSLQLHHHRSEHWVVVNGTALVEINNKEKVLKENESTYIPLGTKHRLSNPGKVPLVLIEVQSGSYLQEDDIVRFEDKYGR